MPHLGSRMKTAPAPAIPPRGVLAWLRAWWSRLAPRRPERPPLDGELSGLLRAFRVTALWGIAIVTATADGAAFSESYRGLFEWAQSHGLSGFWAAAFPLQVDLFIVVGELVLFVAMLDHWGHRDRGLFEWAQSHGLSGFWAAAFPLQVDLFIVVGELVLFVAMLDHWGHRDRAGAWLVALLGLAVSIAGNVGPIHAHDLQSRGTAAVPPIAAFGALWLGLGVLKRILRRRRGKAAAVAQNAQAAAERDALAGVLDELTGAVLLLARQSAEPPVQPAPDTAQIALLGELLEAVGGLGGQLAGSGREPVADDAESAAVASYRATALAGNPWSQRQLETRFG